MENFEKCTVAMLGGPCSQHVTGNTSRLNQPQSAIISYTDSLAQSAICLDLVDLFLRIKWIHAHPPSFLISFHLNNYLLYVLILHNYSLLD